MTERIVWATIGAVGSKYQQTLLLSGLIIVLAIVLFVVFGPVDIQNLGQLGSRQEKQQSFAYALDVPPASDLVVSPVSACDNSGKRAYSFGWFKNSQLPTVEEASNESLQFKFAIKKATEADWEYVDGSGFLHKTLDVGSGVSLFQYRLAPGVNAGDNMFETDEYSEPITFATNCEEEVAFCLPYGDVNLDGQKSSVDVNLISNYISNGSGLTLPQMFAADVNRDGRIDSLDMDQVLDDSKCG